MFTGIDFKVNYEYNCTVLSTVFSTSPVGQYISQFKLLVLGVVVDAVFSVVVILCFRYAASTTTDFVTTTTNAPIMNKLMMTKAKAILP